MKFMIAGFGSIGRRHLNNLFSLGEKDVFLFRTHHSTLQDSETAGLLVETDLQRALDRQPEAVIIANPTSLHLEVAIPCAESGCSILMEKPISHSLNGVPELQKALKKGGGRFLTGFQFRFHPGLRQVRQWLIEGKIGQVLQARSNWGEYLPNWHPWEDYRNSYSARPDLGGGVVNTLSHPLDYLGWMLGEPENLVATTSKNGLGLPVEDTADIFIRYTSGSSANIHLDYLQQPPQHTLDITGTTGSIRWDNYLGLVRRFDTKLDVWEEFNLPPGFERNHLFLAELSHFIRVAHGDEEPACTLKDGLKALEVAMAIHKSSQEGCLVKF